MNPFASLGPPPADDAKAQLAWLADAIRALAQAKDPKLRPLKKRFARVVFQFQRAIERGDDETKARARIGPEMDALLLAVLRAIGRTVEQIASTLRVKQARGNVGADVTALIVELQTGAQQFHALADGVQRGDANAVTNAQRGLADSSHRLAEPIQRIAS